MQSGKTYAEIIKLFNNKISKSVLSYWYRRAPIPSNQRKTIETNRQLHSQYGRKKALLARTKIRARYLWSIDKRIQPLQKLMQRKTISKLIAATLYLGEGSKTKRGSLVFGNSNPSIIALFLHTLRFSYTIDEAKFRCTVQCRADQNTRALEQFWHTITKIPLRQFYKTRIDPRTIGKPSLKPEYKGVCRIDYFSADIFIELLKIGQLISSGR